jgi:hypothetical protein
MSISPAAMAVLAGCGVTATTEYPAADQAVLVAMAGGPTGCPRPADCILGGCPDQKDCTNPNGPGVFFEEDGSVGINAPGENVMMMITEFTNKAAVPLQDSSVTFKGRYSNPFAPLNLYPNGQWLWTDGTIESADYTDLKGTHAGLKVVKLSEQNTMPTWTLADPKQPNTTTSVSGDSFLHLTLHITFPVVNPGLIPVPLTPVQVQLDFDQAKDIVDTGFTLHASNLLWSPDGGSPQGPVQYCLRGPKHQFEPDKVVFQQGISVDPVSGIVTADPNVVTMSCTWGSVAKVYNWGYDYVPQQSLVPFLYQSAIHMKRAAFCGDFDYHTIDGLQIGISDNSSPPINSFFPPNFIPEAQWSTDGATCVTLNNQRDLNKKFVGYCPNKQKHLPECPTPPQPGPPPTLLKSYANPDTQYPSVP